MQKAARFEDLILWQKAHAFVLAAYQYSEAFPKGEVFGLTSQFRRAAISIPANIAEGFKKRSRPDKARFLDIAEGSVEECRYYLILARDLGYGNPEQLLTLLEEVGKMLGAYCRTLLSPSS